MTRVSYASVATSHHHAGLVKRYHTWPVLRQQSVAEHSWQVMRLLITLFPEEVTPDVLEYALWHDVAEIGTGDVPFQVKRAHPELKAVLDDIEGEVLESLGITLPGLTDRQRALVKLCDILEMFEFGMDEVLMGNRYGEPIVDDTRTAALDLAFAINEVDLVLKFMGETT